MANEGTSIYVVFMAKTLSHERIVIGCDRALECLDRNLNALQVECDAWREETARRIRDAVTKRRELIDALPATTA